MDRSPSRLPRPHRHPARVLCGCLTLALVAALTGCGPGGSTLQEIYAERPDLHPLDTSALEGRRILIDPGHGGAFAGSRGVDDTREADVNLGVGLYLWGLLRDAGADVHLTRSSDRDLLPEGSDALRDDLAQRVALLDSLQPEVFLSLHHNSNAALDRERNAVETYFKLDDEGPSYDLARAVHRALAGALGIEQATLRPGNYFVLRESDHAAAILGEASYLSNPDVESRLQLAEKQMLEAEAYFIGLIDYFSRGIPRLTWPQTASDTLRPDARLQVRVEGDARSAIDPLSLQVRLDGRPTAAFYDAAMQTLTLPLTGRRPGRHSIDVRVRNLRGNAAAPLRRSFVVWDPPGRVRLRQEPTSAAPGAAGRVHVQVFGRTGSAVGDGVPVTVYGQNCRVLPFEQRTRNGAVIIGVAALQRDSALRVVAGSVDTLLSLAVHPEAAASRLVQVGARHDHAALRDTWVQPVGEAAQRTDRAGVVVLAATAESLLVWRRAYVPLRSATQDSLRLQPVHQGAFLGESLVLDPVGSGLEPTDPVAGVSRQQLAFDLALGLESRLQAAGARARLTRGAVEQVPELERVRLASRTGARFHLRLEASLTDRHATLLHYPNSSGGQGLAAAMAHALVERGVVDSVRIDTDTQPILLQTPCPALVVRLPFPEFTAVDDSTVTAVSMTQRIYALQRGLRLAFGEAAEHALHGTVFVSGASPLVPDAVLLDRSDLLDIAPSGHFTFDGVSPGPHELVFLHGDTRWEHWVTVDSSASTTVHLDLLGQNP